MLHPKKIETAYVETLNNELCIYDWQRLEVHALNPTAAKVWQLCDGQTSPAQMAEKLQAELDTPHAEELVWLTLQRLEKAHLLQSEGVKRVERKVLTRRELLVGLGVTATLLPVVSSIVAPRPVEAQSPVATSTVTGTPTATPTGTLTPTATPTTTPTPTATRPTGSQTFNFTGAEQQFTVPAGVTSVTVEAFGAEGGDANVSTGTLGRGGRTVATITVTAGETLFVYVGGRGGDGSVGSPGVGGFNGGGGSGNATASSEGGGGGGASDVRQGGNGLANRVVVAGGGGGSGGGGGNIGGEGGDGGGTTGGNGQNGSIGSGGGGGGTQISGGTGGTSVGGNPSGANGSLGAGGTGSGTNLAASGGGGGGGYFGGGGGGSMDLGMSGASGGGGGGGSSFAIPAATGVTHTQGIQSGNGQVIISW